MKRILLSIMATMLLVGCARSEHATLEPVKESRFMTIESNLKWSVVADRETGVMYAVSNGAYNLGEFEVLVDADGNPLIWDGVNGGNE